MFWTIQRFRQLVPVVDVLELHLFHRRAGHDHAVVFFVADLVKRLIEREHVLRGGVPDFVGRRLQQLDVDLQRRVGKQAQELRFGFDLGRHQVENQNLQRADILRLRARFGHDENVFAFEPLFCGQPVVDFDGHGFTSRTILLHYSTNFFKCKYPRSPFCGTGIG